MKLLKSFLYALRGIYGAAVCERNFRIHIAAAVTVLVFSLLYDITKTQAVLLIMAICLVMSAELLNTAVEAMVDIISPQKCRKAEIAKDSAAGAVLIFAFGAVMIAAFIYSDISKLLAVINILKKNIIWVIIYIAVCAALVFVAPYGDANSANIKKYKGENQ